MKTYDSLLVALQDLRDFAIDKPEACPPAIFDMIRTQSTDLVSFGKLLTAIYRVPVGAGDDETVGPQLAQISAGALGVFAQSGFLDIGKADDTGVPPAARMRLALLRDAGEPAIPGLPWPDPESDPPRTSPEPSEDPAPAPTPVDE